jgi:hypothetical protein
MFKSKLSPQDLDDVLKKLQNSDTKMSSFTQYANSEISKNELAVLRSNSNSGCGSQEVVIKTDTRPGSNLASATEVKNERTASVKREIESVVINDDSGGQGQADSSINASDMDSTFIADSSANNLNTSAS